MRRASDRPARQWTFRVRCLQLAGLLLALPAASSLAAATSPAIVIEEGSVARREVVAVGRDVVVIGEASGDVVSINGSARVEGRVGGDVIVLGGDALLGPRSRVVGDLFVLGGRVAAEPGSRIDGRSVSYPTASAAWLTLLEGPAVGLDPWSPVVLGAKLALLAAWLVLTLLLFATAGGQILGTSEAVRANPFRNFVVGVTAVFALLLTALLFSAFAAAMVGVPLLAVVVMVALLLKMWGMVGVFHAAGHWIVFRVLRRRMLPLNCALLGLLILGGVKLIPWVGVWVWTVATFLGVGSTLTTKFGRHEPWFDFEAASLDRA